MITITPVNPSFTPGESYAFAVNVEGHPTGYATDLADALSLAKMLVEGR